MTVNDNKSRDARSTQDIQDRSDVRDSRYAQVSSNTGESKKTRRDKNINRDTSNNRRNFKVNCRSKGATKRGTPCSSSITLAAAEKYEAGRDASDSSRYFNCSSPASESQTQEIARAQHTARRKSAAKKMSAASPHL